MMFSLFLIGLCATAAIAHKPGKALGKYHAPCHAHLI